MKPLKLIVSIVARDLDSVHKYKVIGSEKDNVMIEFDYDTKLWNFIDRINREHIEAEFYQIGVDETDFDDEDKISVSEILRLLLFD